MWSVEYGPEHNGRAAAVFPDGRVSVGAAAGGTLVRTLEEVVSGSWAPMDTIDGRTAVGWRWVCSCGQAGPVWWRAPTSADHDPARHQVHAPGAGVHADPPDDLEEAIGAEWRAHLPSPAIAVVSAAAEAARKAGADLDDAVRLARDAGESWAAIGDAAGMTRQAANERWGKRLRPVVTGGGQDQ